MRFSILISALFLTFAGSALASGGNYTINGGNAFEQQQVRQALAASSFDWSVVPGPVRITIAPSPSAEAVPGEIFLDPGLLDSGRFAWGVVQHEYAHEVDFALFDAATHERLRQALGAPVWCYGDNPSLAHNQYGCERFASTLAWAYWQSPDNSMKPAAIDGESGAISPAAFRALLASVLGTPQQPSVVATDKGYAPKVARRPASSRTSTAK
jgi:hypothetical protein